MLAAISFGALLTATMPAMAQTDTDSGSDAASITQQTALIQAEAQSEVARSTAAAASALTALDEGPVHPQAISTPPGVTVAAPAAPAAAPLPPIDYSKLPPDLARPVTINWNGPVTGAIAAIAAQINYTVLASPVAAASPPSIFLDTKGTPAAALFEKIGAEVAQYGTVAVDPNHRTVQLLIKPAAAQ